MVIKNFECARRSLISSECATRSLISDFHLMISTVLKSGFVKRGSKMIN